AVRHCAEDRPDLILMDLIMPVMDGVEATRKIMAQSPCAILVVTANVESNSGKVFEAMGAGALDAVNTPVLNPANAADGATALLSKIAIIRQLVGADSKKATPPSKTVAARSGEGARESLVAIGSSAGGPGALASVLSGLPPDFPAAVVIVQHVD